MKHSTGKPTKAQQKRFDALKQLGCIACMQKKHQMIAVTGFEIHHLLSGNRRMGHDFTIPLCIWHHRGQIGPLWNAKIAKELLGPSLAHGSKPFHAHFGSDQFLLAEANRLIEKGHIT